MSIQLNGIAVDALNSVPGDCNVNKIHYIITLVTHSRRFARMAAAKDPGPLTSSIYIPQHPCRFKLDECARKLGVSPSRLVAGAILAFQ